MRPKFVNVYQSRVSRLRYAIGRGLLVYGIIGITISSIIGYVAKMDGGELLQSAIQDLAMTMIAFGFGLWAIDPNITEMESKANDFAKLIEKKEDILRRMRSRVSGIAARASEELHEHGWGRDDFLKDEDFSGVNWSGVYLIGANLQETDLERADISNADLRQAKFNEASLRKADFSGSDLTGADFTDADLQEVNFEGAFLDHVNFDGAYMDGANLKGASINGAALGWDATEESFHEEGGTIFGPAKFTNSTILPNGKSWTDETDMSIFTGKN